MKIVSLSAKIPSLEVSNEKIIKDVDEANRDLPPDVVKAYKRRLSHLLVLSGARKRYYRDRQKGETAIGLVQAAMTEALEKASLKKSDVDLLIYCGVGRGFLEPANSYFCAKALGMSCSCFDVVDACMSWVRSLEVAYHFLMTSRYQHVMIVNAEFTAFEYGYPHVFKIRTPEQLTYTFAAYTIGEAATATILSKSQSNWTFDFDSDPELASLCTLPLRGYQEFCTDEEDIGLNGVNGFVAFGSQLLKVGVQRIARLAIAKVKDLKDPDIWFPHTPTASPPSLVAEKLGVDPHKVFDKSFPTYGNLGSASIPVAMSMALDEGALARGSKVVLCPASAGMAFAIVQFEL